jgi:pimeloyl-ACP methyl ester carboxylesterase
MISATSSPESRPLISNLSNLSNPSTLTPANILHWRQRVGAQRDWIWRGWQIRYTYFAPSARTQPAIPEPLLAEPLFAEPLVAEPLVAEYSLGESGIAQASGAPIILLHGFGASIGHWRHNLEALGQTRPVYALDLLGFGASEKTQAPYNLELWVEQLHDFWLAVVGRPAILVGNSIGSSVSLAAASAYPEMAKGVVMISLPDASVLELPKFLQPLLPLLNQGLAPLGQVAKAVLTHPVLFDPLFRWVRRPQMIRRWVSKAYVNQDRITDELVEILSKPAYTPQARQALTAMVRAPNPTQDYRAKTILPDLTMPLLLLWGKQDTMVPPSLAPRFLAYNANLKLIELDQAGHCPHDECPERVNPIILDWLRVHDL